MATKEAKTQIILDRFSATMAAIHPHSPLSRFGIYWSKGRLRFGTLMRYFIFQRWRFCGTFAGTVSEFRLPAGRIALTVEGASVGLVGGSQGTDALLLRTAIEAVDIAAVADAAKYHQLVATGTIVEAGRRFHDTVSSQKQWTTSASTAILFLPTVQYVGIAVPG